MHLDASLLPAHAGSHLGCTQSVRHPELALSASHPDQQVPQADATLASRVPPPSIRTLGAVLHTAALAGALVLRLRHQAVTLAAAAVAVVRSAKAVDATLGALCGARVPGGRA